MSGCRKIRYRDRTAAQIAHANLQLAGKRGTRKEREGLLVYKCPHCRGWHLGRNRA